MRTIGICLREDIADDAFDGHVDAGSLASPRAGDIQDAVIGAASFEPSDDPRDRGIVRLIQINFQTGFVVLFGKIDGQQGAAAWFSIGKNDGTVGIHHISFRAGRIMPGPVLSHLAVALGHSPLLCPASLGNPPAVGESALHAGAQCPLICARLTARHNLPQFHFLILPILLL